MFCVHISTCRMKLCQRCFTSRHPYLEAEGNRFVQNAAIGLKTYIWCTTAEDGRIEWLYEMIYRICTLDWLHIEELPSKTGY